MSSIESFLPPSLLLGPHLSAYRYFFVCTLTIVSWDTLVLTTRSWRLSKTKGWPALKVIMLLLRYLMPIEFIVLAVSCFNPAFTPEVCRKYYLFEPIVTAILMSLSSLALAIRVRAINDTSVSRQRAIALGLGALLAVQVAVHIACCFFYHPLNLQNSHGCISAPKHDWVGIYWVVPTILYLFAFALAVNRSLESLNERQIGWWKLVNRDGLNLYTTIFGINFINVIYFFVTKPSDDADPLKIIVTSLTTVLTSTMTMRVILLVRGPLAMGGSFHGSTAPTSSMSGGTGAGGGSRNATGPFHITAGGPGSRHPASGMTTRAMGSKRTAPGGITPGGVNKSAFPVNRGVAESVDQGEDDEVKVPVGDVADDADARVWNVDKAASFHGEDERGQPGQRKEAWEA